MDQTLIRIDTRQDPVVVEQVKEYIPTNIRVAVKKQAQYKFDCMNGIEHPLKIEVDNYTLVTIKVVSLDKATLADVNNDWYRRFEFSTSELEFINIIRCEPQVEWAEDNSFDGLYVQKSDDCSDLSTSVRLC